MNHVVMKIWDAFESFISFFITKTLRLELSKAARTNFIQFVKFAVVGLSNTIVGYIIYAVTLKCLRAAGLCPSIDIFVAQLVMFILSVAWSFYWNNKAVFKQKNDEKRNILLALFKTYLSYAFTSLILAEALLVLWVNLLGISEYVAPILSLIITVPLNFIIQKYWAFKAN